MIDLLPGPEKVAKAGWMMTLRTAYLVYKVSQLLSWQVDD